MQDTLEVVPDSLVVHQHDDGIVVMRYVFTGEPVDRTRDLTGHGDNMQGQVLQRDGTWRSYSGYDQIEATDLLAVTR